MPTPHIESKKENIAKTVIMPGDPLRAKYIAEKYLQDAKCVNNIRGMLGYTGYYKGKKITVFASGMGCASIGIYAYELYKFYDVDNIIRIGSCGANVETIEVLDVIIAKNAYTLSSYPKLFFDDDRKLFSADKTLTDLLEQKALEKNISYHKGDIITSDIFDVYIEDKEKYFSNYPIPTLASEMEAAALFAIADNMNKKAAAVLTVVDSAFTKEEVPAKDRQNSLDNMISLALDVTLEI